jgi:transposase
MSQRSGSVKEPAEKVVQTIRRATRKRCSAEESEPANAIGPREQANRIVLEGLRGISQNLYYRWSREFLAEREKRLAARSGWRATRRVRRRLAR